MAVLDPIQGLVDYILEIKPYHTKIVEVLIEYIQTDLVDVTITDQIDMCVGIGFPEYDSRYVFPITVANTVTNAFTVSGEQLSKLFIGQKIQVFGSTLNDNSYTVTDLVYDGVNTIISVAETIPDSTADGEIVHFVIEYCPDSGLYSSSIPQATADEACAGGFGESWDSFSDTYDVISVVDVGSPLGAEIRIAGNFASDFSAGKQLVFEYVDTGDLTTVVTEIMTIASSVVDNGDPLNPETVITTTTDTGLGTLSAGVVYLRNTAYPVVDINEGTTANTFTVANDHTDTFVPGSLAIVKFSDGNDGIYYVLSSVLSGTNTRISVAQNVPYPAAINKGTIAQKNIGFDEVIFCAETPEARIDVFFSERLDFGNIELDFADNLFAYNFENTDSYPFGGEYPFGTALSATEPTITESIAAPGSPTVFDLWFDQATAGSPAVINSAVLRQWSGVRWVPITTAYWLDTDDDQLYQRVYRMINGTTIDTGWVPIELQHSFDGGLKVAGIGEIQAIATQRYSAGLVGSPDVGQTQYTLNTTVPYAGSPNPYPITNPDLLSVTVNGVPAGITLDTSTTFTITSPTVEVGDIITAVVKDRNGTASNVLYASGIDAVPHGVDHAAGTVFVNNAGSPSVPVSYDIYGGNFAYHFFGGTIFDGNASSGSPSGLLGQYRIATLPIVGISDQGSPVKDTITIQGDYTAEFSAGKSFFIDYSVNNKGWYSVSTSSYAAGPDTTIITINEEIVKTIFTNDTYGGSPLTLQSVGSPIQQPDYSGDLGVIQGALYDPTAYTTTVIPSAPGDPLVDSISYKWIGPMHLDIAMSPDELLNPTMTGPMGIDGSGPGSPPFINTEIVGGAGYLNIVDADLERDYFVFVGDRTNVPEFNSGSIITVQGAALVGSPAITNNGLWTVDRAFYNGGDTVTVIAADTTADTFTIEGNYADKFIPGFEFMVSQAGSPSRAGSPATNDGNYTVTTSGSPNIGATYDAGTDTTIIPVTTQVPEDLVDGGSPYSLFNGLLTFSGTDQTFVYVTGEIITDVYPYGRVNLSTGTNNAITSAAITDTINFGWTVIDWFQYPIITLDLTDNTITVAGDARDDMQIGQEFELLGAPDVGSPIGGSPIISNNGIYTVRIDEDYRTYGSPEMIRSEVEYDGNNTTITVKPPLTVGPMINDGSPPSLVINGYIEPNNDAAMIIAFSDTIGVIGTETTDGAVLQTGGVLIDSFDYGYWDIGGYDETTGTIIHLYSGTFE